MTPAQEQKIKDIEEKLIDVFIAEADPDNWDQVNPEDEEESKQKSRGNRYWQCKVANQTIALLTRIETYRTRIAEAKIGNKPGIPDGKGVDKDIKAAEKKVRERLSIVKKRAC